MATVSAPFIHSSDFIERAASAFCIRRSSTEYRLCGQTCGEKSPNYAGLCATAYAPRLKYGIRITARGIDVVDASGIVGSVFEKVTTILRRVFPFVLSSCADYHPSVIYNATSGSLSISQRSLYESTNSGISFRNSLHTTPSFVRQDAADAAARCLPGSMSHAADQLDEERKGAGKHKHISFSKLRSVWILTMRVGWEKVCILGKIISGMPYMQEAPCTCWFPQIIWRPFLEFNTYTFLLHDVHSSQTDMGSCAGQRCQRRLAAVLRAGHGLSHEAEVSAAGQTSVDEVKKRDLRAELLAAEQEAQNKKRKAEGKPPLPVENGSSTAEVDEEANKRRKLLQDALEMDKDEEEEEEEEDKGSKPKDDEAMIGDDDDDDDDTAELMRELEKIKRERAAEAERKEREQLASDSAARDAEIATANPLLNLAAALGQTPGISTTVPGTFAVKRRWDDDLIFKNQAMSGRDKQGQFVNDLLRTEFHKYVSSRIHSSLVPYCFVYNRQEVHGQVYQGMFDAPTFKDVLS
ncbi:Cwf15/Cwc15 cell cycle control protein [Salix suchowensis]|nr:Cwf15/Cwc15 cell cycle control protein [Salix suchowensis]